MRIPKPPSMHSIIEGGFCYPRLVLEGRWAPSVVQPRLKSRICGERPGETAITVGQRVTGVGIKFAWKRVQSPMWDVIRGEPGGDSVAERPAGWQIVPGEHVLVERAHHDEEGISAIPQRQGQALEGRPLKGRIERHPLELGVALWLGGPGTMTRAVRPPLRIDGRF